MREIRKEIYYSIALGLLTGVLGFPFSMYASVFSMTSLARSTTNVSETFFKLHTAFMGKHSKMRT